MVIIIITYIGNMLLVFVLYLAPVITINLTWNNLDKRVMTRKREDPNITPKVTRNTIQEYNITPISKNRSYGVFITTEEGPRRIVPEVL